MDRIRFLGDGPTPAVLQCLVDVAPIMEVQCRCCRRATFVDLRVYRLIYRDGLTGQVIRKCTALWPVWQWRGSDPPGNCVWRASRGIDRTLFGRLDDLDAATRSGCARKVGIASQEHAIAHLGQGHVGGIVGGQVFAQCPDATEVAACPGREDRRGATVAVLLSMDSSPNVAPRRLDSRLHNYFCRKFVFYN